MANLQMVFFESNQSNFLKLSKTIQFLSMNKPKFLWFKPGIPLYCDDVLPAQEPRTKKKSFSSSSSSSRLSISFSGSRFSNDKIVNSKDEWGFGFTGIASGQNLNKDVTIFLNVRTSNPGKWVLDVIGNEKKYENNWTRIGKTIYRVDSNGSNMISQLTSLTLFTSIHTSMIK